MIKASAVVLAVGEISPEGSRLYIMGIHSGVFFLFQTILYVLQVIHLHISVNIEVAMFAWTSLKAAFVGADASVPVFKVPLQRNVEEISPEWGLGLLCLPLKKEKKSGLIYCSSAICNCQFAALSLPHHH